MTVNAADSVKVQWSGTGTGTMTLGAAVTGFQSFPASLDTLEVSYLIEHQTSGTIERENGKGTYNHSAGTLTRGSISFSTNGNTLVNFSVGTKHVSLVVLAEDLNAEPGSHTHTLNDIEDAGDLAALNQVETIHIADDSVTAAKLNSGAAIAGQVYVADGSGGGSYQDQEAGAPFDGIADTGNYSVTPRQITSADKNRDILLKTAVAGTHTIEFTDDNLAEDDFGSITKDTTTSGVIIQLVGDTGGSPADDAVSLRIGTEDVAAGTPRELFGSCVWWYKADTRTVYIRGEISGTVSFHGQPVVGNRVQILTRGSTGSPFEQPSAEESGAYITTAGIVEIPAIAGWHCDLEISSTADDIRFLVGSPGIILDISVEGFQAGQVYTVIVKSATEIRVIGPAGTFTQADFIGT